jgi:hypothetical protein
MKRNFVVGLLGGLVGSMLLLIVFSATGIVGARGVDLPRDEARPNTISASTLLTSTFTYQGQLKNGSNAVNGPCQMAFRLYDDPSAGNLIGNPITPTVPVTNGLFTVRLSFGNTGNVFDGNGRWLDIKVKCGVSSFVGLTPRQQLTAVPYAFALPGLYTQRTVGTPNIIGGYSGNAVLSGVVGATIGGGGDNLASNIIVDDYGTVSGGETNFAGDINGTIGDSPYATISGGLGNTAAGYAATVGGGRGNTASGSGAFVGGGGYDGTFSNGNKALGAASTIAGGVGNIASGLQATIGGGWSNNASYLQATVGGGVANNASYTQTTIGGGVYNIASGLGATVPGGSEAKASHYGEMAYASGRFVMVGDAQTSVYVLRNTTGGSVQTELFLDGAGASQRITLAVSRTVTFDILITALSSTGQSAGYQVRGAIKNLDGATQQVGLAFSKTVFGEDDAAWDVDVQADNTNDALVVKVTGAAATNIHWVATVRTVEVGY